MQVSKIDRPIPGPVEPPPPEPVEHVPYRKETGIEVAKPKVWAVVESELEPICQWLVPRLRKKWPNLSEDGVRFWLRAAISDRMTHFIRTENVVGMVYSSVDVLESQPIVFEKFVRCNKGASNEEKLLIYATFRNWARSIKAREFVFGLDTDVSMDQSTEFGGVAKHLQNDREASNVSRKMYCVCVLRET